MLEITKLPKITTLLKITGKNNIDNVIMVVGIGK